MTSRLEKYRKQKNLSQAQLAEMASTSQPQINRLEKGDRKLTVEWAERLAPYLEIEPQKLLFGKADTPEPKSELKKIREVGSIPIIGAVRAGSWLEVDQLNYEADQEHRHIPALLDYPLDWQYAFTVEGASLNKRAEEGDILQCVDLIQSGLDIIDGDLVIVERTLHDGALIERTAKLVRKTSAGFELWPESTDPAHQSPIVVNGAEMHEEVRIKAVVIWIMKNQFRRR